MFQTPKKSPQFLDLTGAGPTREVHFLDLGSGVGKKLGKGPKVW